MKTCHLPFISLFWLQRSLLFVGNIHAIYLFLSLLHCTGAGVVSMAMLLSLAAPEGFTSTTYRAASDPGAVGETTLSFQWVSKDNIDSVAMCAGRVTLRSTQSHRDFSVSLRSYCYLFACYYHFLLCLFVLCHLWRTIALLPTVICWLYPTFINFMLSYIYIYICTCI